MIGFFSANTVTDATCASSWMTLSTSIGWTFWPPTLIVSDLRPRIFRYSPSTSTASPVSNQPSSVNGLGAFR